MPFTDTLTRYLNTQYLSITYIEQSLEDFHYLGFESKEPKNKVSMLKLDFDVVLVISNLVNNTLFKLWKLQT